MNKILFSVVIPLYNKEKYIARTIQSVLDQTWSYFEIVVVNDGSTDNSVEVVEKFKDERIQIIHQPNNGVSVARNNGMKAAKYNWIAFLDGDDEWKPEFLETIRNAILSSSQSYIGYATGFLKYNHKNEIYYPKLKYIPNEQGKLKNYYKSCFCGQQVITSSSICLNKQLLIENNLLELFPVGIKRGEDLHAWTCLNLNNDIYFINQPLVRINSVIDNVSNSEYNINESFNYKKWLGYKTDTVEKKIFLFFLVLKRQSVIFKKLIMHKQLRDINILIKRFFNLI